MAMETDSHIKSGHNIPRRRSLILLCSISSSQSHVIHNNHQSPSHPRATVDIVLYIYAMYIILLHRNNDNRQMPDNITPSAPFQQNIRRHCKRNIYPRARHVTWEYSLLPAASPSACSVACISTRSGCGCQHKCHLLICNPVIPK